jgi:hypothetical protein
MVNVIVENFFGASKKKVPEIRPEPFFSILRVDFYPDIQALARKTLRNMGDYFIISYQKP